MISVEQQMHEGIAFFAHKYPNMRYIAYFQAYTNTYASLDRLKEIYEPFIQREDVIAVCIATRADCLNDENIAYLDSFAYSSAVKIAI